LNSASRPSPPSFPLNGDDLPDGIFLSDFQQGEIVPDLFRAACNMGLEGLVSKRWSAPWRSRDHSASLRFYLLAAVLWHSGAHAQERRSTDFIVPLGYCQLTSVAFFEFQIYTANQREGASPPLARS
jgi:hypothetical protein